jgi:hypothetical protein
LKTVIVLECSDIRSLCAVEKRTGKCGVQFGAVSEFCIQIGTEDFRVIEEEAKTRGLHSDLK